MKCTFPTCLLGFVFFSNIILAQENTSSTCADSKDNDGDGKIDCQDEDCQSLTNNSCTLCSVGRSYADEVISFTPGEGAESRNPKNALGINNYIQGDATTFATLGVGGTLKLGFVDNILVNSGDSEFDLWIFEVGRVEPTQLSLKPYDLYTKNQLVQTGFVDSDNDGFYEFGEIDGSAFGIDIDAFIPGYPNESLKFDGVSMDDMGHNDLSINPGADIGAVCASSFIPMDCAGVLNGTSVIDECGECLESDDPSFNQSCTDCEGTLNGAKVTDECGECLEPNDPKLDQTCTDCAGVLNGTAISDDCGVCLSPNDPEFNQTCTDCAGIPNGTAILDGCGICLEPTDEEFNQSCTDCAGVLNGPSVLDDCGVCLPPNDFEFNQECVDCADTPNGTAILDECGVCLEPDVPEFNQACVKKRVYIPNAFTPNNDGLNDMFYPISNENGAQVIFLDIYNRWGELVYRQEGFPVNHESYGWNGRYQGQRVAMGTYLYQMEVKLPSEEKLRTYQGKIQVIP